MKLCVLAESLVNQLFLLIQPNVHPGIQKQAFRYLYLVSKVRGPKVMVRWFPHEVKDFEPVLVLLQQQDPHDCEVSHSPQSATPLECRVMADVGDPLHPPAVALLPADDPL